MPNTSAYWAINKPILPRPIIPIDLFFNWYPLKRSLFHPEFLTCSTELNMFLEIDIINAQVSSAVDEISFKKSKWPLKDKSSKHCVIGLYADPERLSDIRRNRVAIMKDNNATKDTNLESIKKH